MRRNQPIARLQGAALVLGLLTTCAAAARADVALDGIKLTYHGGRMIQNVKVVPVFLGSSWVRNSAPTYIKNFLHSLFADGRYMANLAQYSAGGYKIGNGTAVDPVTDLKVLSKVDAAHAAPGIHYQISDEEIQAELKAQITAGKLPQPDANTLYAVLFQYDVVVVAGNQDSENGLAAYHSYDTDIGAAYCAVNPTFLSPTLPLPGSPTGYTSTLFNRHLTSGLSHEMAEAVTDTEFNANGGSGWYVDSTGEEIGDIPATLINFGYITDDQFYDLLTGADGTKYAVQRVWSVKDKTPTAFAATTAITP